MILFGERVVSANKNSAARIIVILRQELDEAVLGVEFCFFDSDDERSPEEFADMVQMVQKAEFLVEKAKKIAADAGLILRKQKGKSL